MRQVAKWHAKVGTMRNLLVERDLSILLELGEGEEPVASCCSFLDQPLLYVATSECNILCLSTDSTPQV